MLLSVPLAVRKFADGIQHPVALIGCRATGTSLDCCEYDLAVLAPGANQVVQLDGHTIELVHFGGAAKSFAVDLGRTVMLKDTNRFVLSSTVKEITSEKFQRALAAVGKKSLISSLFCQHKMRHAKHPAAAMWLKIASYDFVEGTLALSGSRPMPLHELEQVRQADSPSMVEGLEVALDCIGMERATRPAISRSIKAIKELNSKDYDRDIFASKVDHLLGKSMLTDCYYYAGRIAAKNLARRQDAFYNGYSKLVQLALDLSSDLQSLEKMQKKLFRAVNSALKR
jgi:hypothetical protein